MNEWVLFYDREYYSIKTSVLPRVLFLSSPLGQVPTTVWGHVQTGYPYTTNCSLSNYRETKWLILLIFQPKSTAFSALTLLAGCQEQHPASKKIEGWSAGMVICLEQGCKVQIICMWSSWCHCHPIISCFLHENPHWFNLSGDGLLRFLEKRPLNRDTFHTFISTRIS